MPEFRELFPEESPKLGRLLNVATVSLLAIDISAMDQLFDSLGDSNAFSVAQRFHGLINEVMGKHAGALVKASGTDALFAFDTPLDAIKAVDEFAETLQRQDDLDVCFCAAVHRGTVLATSIDGHLAYFGGNVHVVQQMLRHAGDAELWMTEAVASEPQVVAAIRERQRNIEVHDLPGIGRHGIRCQRVSFALTLRLLPKQKNFRFSLLVPQVAYSA